MIDWLK